MLKSPNPDSRRRAIGRVAATTLAVAISAAAYAAAQPPVQIAKASAHAPEYQLAMRIRRGDAMFGAPIVCMNAGGSASISQVENSDNDAWSFDLNLRMQMADRDQAQVSLDGSLRSGGVTMPLHSSMRGALGQPMALRVDGEHGAPATELEIVPTRGCSARHAPPPPPPPPDAPPPPPPPPPPHQGGRVMPPPPAMAPPPPPAMPVPPTIPTPAAPMDSANPEAAPRPATAPAPAERAAPVAMAHPAPAPRAAAAPVAPASAVTSSEQR